MNFNETSHALGLAQAFDRRTVGEMDVRAWHSVLGDYAIGDVTEAIRRHYSDQTDWIMPAHIKRIIGEIEQERAKAERKWAAGQWGVAADEAHPEITGPIDDSNMPEDVKAKLRELLAERFPDASREKLKPRTVAWEREQRAYLRVREPNPLYRPQACRGAVCEAEPCVFLEGGVCTIA